MTPMARAMPLIAHPAFHVICDIPPEPVLLVPVADDVLEAVGLVVLEPDELVVLEPDVAEVCVIVVLDFDAVPLEVVIETLLVLPVIEPVDDIAAFVMETDKLSVRVTTLN
jgi:hypothetical protein